MAAQIFRVFSCCVLLAVLAIAPGHAEPLKLRLTLQFPITDPFQGKSVADFKVAVERETENAVTIEILDKLDVDYQALDAVKSGAVEMGVAGLNQVTKVIPAASIMEQPFLFNFEALVHAATSPDSEMRQLIDNAILISMGVRVLWWQTIGSQVFYTTKDGDLRNPDQLKGLKTRVNSETMASLVTYCGGVPIDVAASKIHDRLKDGTIDASMSGIAAVKTLGLWEVSRAVTKTDHATIEFLVVINENSWRQLSETQQQIFIKEARTVERRARERAAMLETAGFEFARSKGMQIYELAPADVAEWRACSADVFTNYLEQTGEFASELMAAYAKLRQQPCCSAGPAANGFKGQ
jgi:C4-dicarboxylate-binding protein DctP